MEGRYEDVGVEGSYSVRKRLYTYVSVYEELKAKAKAKAEEKEAKAKAEEKTRKKKGRKDV